MLLDFLTNMVCYWALTFLNQHSNSAFSLSLFSELQVLSAKFDFNKEYFLTLYKFMQVFKSLV